MPPILSNLSADARHDDISLITLDALTTTPRRAYRRLTLRFGHGDTKPIFRYGFQQLREAGCRRAARAIATLPRTTPHASSPHRASAGDTA